MQNCGGVQMQQASGVSPEVRIDFQRASAHMLQNVQQERVRGNKALSLIEAIGVVKDMLFVVHLWLLCYLLPFYSSVVFISPHRSRSKAGGTGTNHRRTPGRRKRPPCIGCANA